MRLIAIYSTRRGSEFSIVPVRPLLASYIGGTPDADFIRIGNAAVNWHMKTNCGPTGVPNRNASAIILPKFAARMRFLQLPPAYPGLFPRNQVPLKLQIPTAPPNTALINTKNGKLEP
jgi:hypothetical protein